jgi:catechol 2,3-dioxygenase-like lactoylglutathione lyase family enzyme
VQIDGLHHVALQVRDVAKVARFYVEVLGLPVLERYLRDDGTLRSIWVGLGARADAGFLAVEAAPESTPDGVLGFSMVALRISAAHRAQIARELEQRGVTIEKQTGWTMYFRDPEGNLVGLSHHPDAAESGGGRDGTTR